MDGFEEAEQRRKQERIRDLDVYEKLFAAAGERRAPSDASARIGNYIG